MTSDNDQAGWLPRERLELLFNILTDNGYSCVGPRVRDGAIVYEPVHSVADLPQGVTDQQQPGHYRLSRDNGVRNFSWANGPQALKPMVFSPREQLWGVARDDDGRLQFFAAGETAQKRAVIGVRACDLAALRLQDQHFLERDPVHDGYRARRAGLFLVAVNCTHPAQTCFCVSTGDGPRATAGFDLALSELDDGFVVQAGSDAGRAVFSQLALAAVDKTRLDQAAKEISDGAARQTRALPSRNLRDVLFANLDHERWDEVAVRCLSCGNCTSVCPTCFCHKETEQPQLDGAASEHYREWDSCFTQGHSYIHGVAIRAETRERYRQWLTHKLGSWHDQYGRSGCVGCGRCIAWCPVGIDITEEATAICGGSE